MPEINLTIAPGEITIGAAGLAEILQNVRMIVATPKGSVPLDRDFGVSWAVVDMAAPAARVQMTAEIYQQVAKYEPRARVTSVDWRESAGDEMDGLIQPVVRIEVIES